jgi:calpain-7
LAISVAENLMKAMKLSSIPDEKRQLKAECGVFMDLADRIKNDPHWRPQDEAPQPAHTKNEQIGQWAAEVAVEALVPETVSVSGFEDVLSQSALSGYGLSFTTAPVDSVSATSGKLSSSSLSLAASSERAQEYRPYETSIVMRDTPTLLVDLSDHFFPSSVLEPIATTDARHENSPKTVSRYATAQRVPSFTTGKTSSLNPEATRFQRRVPKEEMAPPSPSAAPYSNIHRLPEPISTRKRSKKEEIILLKASVVNGFKCPPWDKNPSAAEFVAQQGAELFTDTHDLSLSSYQQQFFQSWSRARDAVPPQSIFSGDRSGIGPLMSSSRTIDLVQDVASDCSVVTSLCAGLARAERGHDQVSNVTELVTGRIELTITDAYQQAVSLRQAARETCSLNKRKVRRATKLQWVLEKSSD